MCSFVAGYGKVFLVQKRGGIDNGRLYCMKVLQKAMIIEKKKAIEHTMTERQVLEAVHRYPFLATLHYAFQNDSKLYLILGEYKRVQHLINKTGKGVLHNVAYKIPSGVLCYFSSLLAASKTQNVLDNSYLNSKIMHNVDFQ
jgi:serine/threonine protein kinase